MYIMNIYKYNKNKKENKRSFVRILPALERARARAD